MFVIDPREMDLLLDDLNELAAAFPSLAAKALTETAKDVRAQVVGWLPKVLDRPTPYTPRSLFIFAAEKEDLRSAVAFKAESERIPRSRMDTVNASRSMRMQVFGGQREMKDSERRLLADGVTTAAAPYLIPAKGAKRDRYGNVTGAFMNRVLYQGVARGSASQGYSSPLNHRRQGNAKKRQYFVMYRKGKTDPVGVYQNMGSNAPPMPVFLFASKAVYKPRLAFHRIASGHVEQAFRQRLDEGMLVAMERLAAR